MYNLEKNEFKGTIHGSLFKYSLGTRFSRRPKITIQNESNGIKITFDHMNKYLFEEIMPIFKSMLVDIKSQKYENIKNNSGLGVVSLRQHDPRLFNNLINDKKYSRLVQKHKQPVVITEEQYKSDKIPKHCKVKFINVTTMKPTFYSCHVNPKNNSIYFITNKH